MTVFADGRLPSKLCECFGKSEMCRPCPCLGACRSVRGRASSSTCRLRSPGGLPRDLGGIPKLIPTSARHPLFRQTTSGSHMKLDAEFSGRRVGSNRPRCIRYRTRANDRGGGRPPGASAMSQPQPMCAAIVATSSSSGPGSRTSSTSRVRVAGPSRSEGASADTGARAALGRRLAPVPLGAHFATTNAATKSGLLARMPTSVENNGADHEHDRPSLNDAENPPGGLLIPRWRDRDSHGPPTQR